MSLRVTLICAPFALASQAPCFPRDDVLDDGARAAIAKTTRRFSSRESSYNSPALAARETASLLGLPGTIDRDLGDLDYGTWAGKSLASIFEEDPRAARRWRNDTTFAEHGGESLARLALRAERWLGARSENGALVVVTHPAFVRALAIVLLRAPIEAFWNLDVRPLHTSEITFDGTRWSLAHLNRSL